MRANEILKFLKKKPLAREERSFKDFSNYLKSTTKQCKSLLVFSKS